VNLKPAAVTAFLAPLVLLSAATPSDAILSILVQGGRVIVSTPKGLFLHADGTKGWSPIPSPPNAPAGGCLNKSSGSGSTIYYSPPYRPLEGYELECVIGWGLWKSNDLGRTWSQVDDYHVFSSVFVHPGGVLYAIAAMRLDWPSVFPEANLRWRAFSSDDGGLTWQLLPGSQAYVQMSLAPCSSNPAHLCGNGTDVIRGHRLEYDPGKAEWTNPIGGRNGMTIEEFFQVGMGTSTTWAGWFPRTQENYFRYPFRPEGVTRFPAIWLHAGAARYTFRKGQPVEVEAVIEVMPRSSPAIISIPEIDSTQECWQVRSIDPEGVRSETARNVPEGPHSPESISMQAIVVGDRYRRAVDLSKMMSFDKPGVYTVQLRFANDALSRRRSGEPVDLAIWTGFLEGEKFTIEIAP